MLFLHPSEPASFFSFLPWNAKGLTCAIVKFVANGYTGRPRKHIRQLAKQNTPWSCAQPSHASHGLALVASHGHVHALPRGLWQSNNFLSQFWESSVFTVHLWLICPWCELHLTIQPIETLRSLKLQSSSLSWSLPTCSHCISHGPSAAFPGAEGLRKGSIKSAANAKICRIQWHHNIS